MIRLCEGKKMFFKNNILDIPADVPKKSEKSFIKNLETITKKTKNLFLFACDQKIEHLNKDFYGSEISHDAGNPEHLFKIGNSGTVGALATNLGLIARWGKKYPEIPYIAKLNGKTNLVDLEIDDPFSNQLWNVEQALALRHERDINICGVGYTLYIGSKYESAMMAQAAQIINQAHNYGLVAIIWIYARAKSVTDDQDPMLISGIAGLAAALGADFVKTKPPKEGEAKSRDQWLEIGKQAAGNTRIIISGGSMIEPKVLLQNTHDYIHKGNVAGVAIGRNIFQRTEREAIALTHALSAIVYHNADVQHALKIYERKK